MGKPKRTEDLVLPPPGLDEAIQALIGKQVGHRLVLSTAAAL